MTTRRIDARSDETPQAAQPEGREPVAEGARPNTTATPPKESPVEREAVAPSFTAEWCLNMARLEGDAEIGAGSLNHPLRLPAPTSEGEAATWLANELEASLVAREETRFKTVAFVHRHTILAALRTQDTSR